MTAIMQTLLFMLAVLAVLAVAAKRLNIAPSILLVVAGLISVWAASGVIKSLMEGFQAAYRIPRSRGFIHKGLVAMALVLGSAVPLVLQVGKWRRQITLDVKSCQDNAQPDGMLPGRASDPSGWALSWQDFTSRVI